MKALILNSQGHTEEAFALAKIALKNDMKSHVCWHVYGLLYRSVKNFEESIKAYKFALRLEPESPQIQRDLALLQIQMRDYQGYLQSRKSMLQARPQSRQNWTALAVAHHLAGDLEMAEKVLTSYEETLKQPPPQVDIEHSEAVLYKNSIIAESGHTQKALDHLESIFKSNLDRAAVMELRAEYLLKLEKREEAEKAYRALIERNNEYRVYYERLEKALDLQQADVEKRRQLYTSYAENFPKLDAARRIPLEFLEGDDFREAANSYLRRALDKGIPSLFANIKTLYSNLSKQQAIQDLAESYLKKSHANSEAETHANGDLPDRFRTSTLYFLAQHYNYRPSRDLSKSTSYIDQAIESEPKSVDYHMTKARIQKHQGNVAAAAKTMDYARNLDLKDRYINTKCAKYQLRNDENEIAIKTMSKFTRNETVGGPLGDLLDMQCMWYLTEDGEAYLRRGKLGPALKRFTNIYDIFDIWQEDQFDFHSFSLRKGQIRAYIDMVRWEDGLRQHPFFARSALSAIKIYCMLHDRPHLAHESLTNGADGEDVNKMDEAEKKRVMKKARKEQEKREREEADRREAERQKSGGKKQTTGADGEPKKEDPDPKGTKLVSTQRPLEDAMNFVGPLLEFSPKSIEGQNAGFEVYLRRRKYLLAAKCLLAAKSIDPSNPTLHEQIVRFQRARECNIYYLASFCDERHAMLTTCDSRVAIRTNATQVRRSSQIDLHVPIPVDVSCRIQRRFPQYEQAQPRARACRAERTALPR